MTVRAKGTYAWGEWPHMLVMVSEEVIMDIYVDSEEWQDYTFPVPPFSSSLHVRITHGNIFDFGSSRDLMIDKIVFNGGDAPAEEPGYCQHTWGITTYARMGSGRVELRATPFSDDRRAMLGFMAFLAHRRPVSLWWVGGWLLFAVSCSGPGAREVDTSVEQGHDDATRPGRGAPEAGIAERNDAIAPTSDASRASDAGRVFDGESPDAARADDTPSARDAGTSETPQPGGPQPEIPPRDLIEWTALMGTEAHDTALGVAVDDQDEVVVVGYTEGTIGEVNRGRGDSFVSSFAADGSKGWATQLGGEQNDWANAVALDVDENIVAVGRTNSTPDTTFDACVTKLAAGGSEVLWEQYLAGEGADVAHAVGILSDGKIAVAGATTSSLEGAAAGNDDAFLALLSEEGEVLWVRQLGTPGSDVVNALAIGEADDIVVAGQSSGALFGEATGGTDVVVAKYTAEGELSWSLQFGTTADDVANDVVRLSDGAFAVVGTTSGALGMANVGAADGFVSRVTDEGGLSWTQQYGSPTVDQGRAITEDSSGALIAVGLTYGLVGVAPDLSAITLAHSEILLQAYDFSGQTLWTWQGASSESVYPNAIAPDSSGSVYIVGSSIRRVDSESTDSDGFLLRYP